MALPAFALNGSCSFQAKGLSINFGTLNPSNAVNMAVNVAAATLNANKAGHCTATMTISAGNGLHFTAGSRRMTSAGGDFIPYVFFGLGTVAAPGNANYATFTFQGGILGTDYANASAGVYNDTVTVSVNP
jgi:spore coat protein U-like protein